MQGRPSKKREKFSYPSAGPAKSIMATDFIRERLKKIFHLDPHYCDVVELTLLKLAGIEEKPDKCQFDGGMNPFLTKDHLDPNYSTSNSVFFKLSLSTDAMKQLIAFLDAKNIKFHDYTSALSEEDKKLNIKVFCIGYESFEDVVCQEIIKYLRNNRQVVDEHLNEINKRTGRVTCYEYTRCSKGGIYQQEIFIPSEKICFTKDKAYKTDKPNNIDEEYFKSPTILKKLSLPIKWIDKLKEELKENNAVELKEDVYFDPLLVIDFVADENNFLERYSQFGTFILPNFIMRYFEDADNVNIHSSTATRILELINTLDPTEKQSLAACVEKRISNKLNEKNRTPAFPINFSMGAATVVASAATGFLLESAPAGIFAGGLVLFGKKKYDDYFKNQREEYRNKIFAALDMTPKQYATSNDKCLSQYQPTRFGRG